MEAVISEVGVARALDAYRTLMRALQLQRAKRGIDPWSACPMTMPQLRALSLIVASQHGLSSRELAALLSVGPSAVTPLVDRLVEHGFVRRLEDPHDRRIARLEATPSGTEALERMLAGQGDVMREALSTLTADELKLVSAAFAVLTDAIQHPLTPSPGV
ncbi:MAG TPA: MarR family transcriptional regulator [Chloroflexota bacterium]